jgi:transcriptional regulator PpsR
MSTRESDFWNERYGPRISPEYFGEIVATAADLALVVSEGGTVISATTNPLNASLGKVDHWVGRDLRAFLARDSVEKFERSLARLTSGEEEDGVGAVELNHQDNAAWSAPMRYTLHHTGRDGRILMMGRDLRPVAELQQKLVRAQLALERDYQSQRDYQTRYRVILDRVRDAFVLLDIGTGRILDANGAAARLIGVEPGSLTGAAFTQEFDGRRRSEFLDGLSASASTGGGAPVEARLRRSGETLRIHPHLFRAAGERLMLCRLDAADAGADPGDALAHGMLQVFRAGPDAVVFTDRDGDIVQANDAFLTLCDAGSLSDVRSRSLSVFLARGAIDLRVLLEAVERDGQLRAYGTRLRSAYGTQTAVEISAVPVDGPGGAGLALVIRDGARGDALPELGGPVGGGTVDGAAMQNMMNLVGSAPLKDIVASTTDVIEKMCIETAVDLTGNNRVAAAEMLGLSRQSLYVKLRKYGLLNRQADRTGE